MLVLVVGIVGNSFVVHSQETVNDTFETEGHHYDMSYIFKNYNIFSFDDATGAHINGPVIAGGGVFKLAEGSFDINVPQWNGKKSQYGPNVSDFTRSVPNNNSYIKGDYASTGGYTHARRLYVGVENDNHVDRIKNNPDVEIIKSDHYIDWDKAYSVLNAQSQKLLNNAQETLSLDDIITTPHGERYIIVKEHDNLLITEEVFNNYDYIVYLNNGKPFDLGLITINYNVRGSITEKMNVVTHDETAALNGSLNLGALYHSLAYDGYHPNGPNVSGNEKAINIIHNYPYASTIINKQTQRFGQLFAVNATVYDNVGNVNGNMIVHALYSPNSEPHFWPIDLSPVIPKERLYNIEGYKIDSETEETLLGAEISLFSESDELLAQARTDEKGYFKFENLREGTYTLTETQAPEGYELGDNSVKIIFDETSERLFTHIFKNKKEEVIIPEEKYYTISGVKVDAHDERRLQGAEITLYRDQEIIATQITDEDGYFSFDTLSKGSYLVKETKAPEGYDLGHNEVEISFDDESDIHVSLTFKNQKVEEEIPKDNHYFINGYKKDRKQDIGLKNAEITLYDSDGNILEITLSDEEGFFEFTNLSPKTYIIEETKAPEGYELGDNKVTITLHEEQSSVHLIFKNDEYTKEPDKPTEPKPEEPEVIEPEEPEEITPYEPVIPGGREPKPKEPVVEYPPKEVPKEEVTKPSTPHTGLSTGYLTTFYSVTLLLALAIMWKLKRSEQ